MERFVFVFDLASLCSLSYSELEIIRRLLNNN